MSCSKVYFFANLPGKYYTPRKYTHYMTWWCSNWYNKMLSLHCLLPFFTLLSSLISTSTALDLGLPNKTPSLAEPWEWNWIIWRPLPYLTVGIPWLSARIPKLFTLQNSHVLEPLKHHIQKVNYFIVNL